MIEDAIEEQSRTEYFVRHRMLAQGRKQYQPIALRVLAESAGHRAAIADIERPIRARHPGEAPDVRKFPLSVLAGHDLVRYDDTHAWLDEELDKAQTAALLRALDERAVRILGMRLQGEPWRLPSGSSHLAAIRDFLVEYYGEVCAVPGCGATEGLEMDHIMRGADLTTLRDPWPAGEVNDPSNFQLLCPVHHRAKSAKGH